MLNLFVVLLLVLILAGCGTTHDLIKDVEGKAYDSLAQAFSEYCERQEGPLALVIKQEALEARREIRQRGVNGPEKAVGILGLDEKTAAGSGPTVRVYCAGDKVPNDVWVDFVRTRI